MDKAKKAAADSCAAYCSNRRSDASKSNVAFSSRASRASRARRFFSEIVVKKLARAGMVAAPVVEDATESRRREAPRATALNLKILGITETD